MSSVLIGVKRGNRLVRVRSSDLRGRRPETRDSIFVGAEIVRTGIYTPVHMAKPGEFSYDPVSELYVAV